MSEVPAAAPVAPATYPGKTLGIVGLVLAILAPIVGLILSIIARSQSKSAGFKNTPATAGIIVGIILTVLYIIIIIASVALASAGLAALCDGQAAGVYETGSGTITCP